MDAATREFVRRRAGERCEYCRLPQAATPLVPFHIEHVIPLQHGGDDTPNNLALSCDRCNAYKGPNLTTVDPESGEIVPLFNPRLDQWSGHFQLDGPRIIGLTSVGIATASLLHMNAARRIELRKEWLLSGSRPGQALNF